MGVREGMEMEEPEEPEEPEVQEDPEDLDRDTPETPESPELEPEIPPEIPPDSPEALPPLLTLRPLTRAAAIGALPLNARPFPEPDSEVATTGVRMETGPEPEVTVSSALSAPAAARASRALHWRTMRWATDGALARIETATGGRARLLSILQTAPGVKKKSPEARLLRLLVNPSLQTTPLGLLCERAGLGIGEVLGLLNSSRLAAAHVQVMEQVAGGLVEVMGTLIQRAQGRAPCGACGGHGAKAEEGGEEKACTGCRGTGVVIVDPDPKAQEMVLQVAGLVKGAGGVNVKVENRNQTQVAVGVGDTARGVFRSPEMAAFVAASDRALSGGRRRSGGLEPAPGPVVTVGDAGEDPEPPEPPA